MVGCTEYSVGYELAKQIGMRARAFQAQMFGRSGINQNPIRLDVEITRSHEFAMKRMVFVGRWKRCGFDQKINDLLKFRKIFGPLLGSFDVFPECGGAADGSHRPRSR